jgi:hypothetical protein
MVYKPKHFSLDEMVCEHVYDTFGGIVWSFFDIRLLVTLDTIREYIDKSIYINSWMVHGEFSQRGFRCIQCQLVKDAIKAKRLYVSPHMTGQGVDFDITGMTAEQGRQWIITNQDILPYNIRLENAVDWIHLDVRGGDQKITLFNS